MLGFLEWADWDYQQSDDNSSTISSAVQWSHVDRKTSRSVGHITRPTTTNAKLPSNTSRVSNWIRVPPYDSTKHVGIVPYYYISRKYKVPVKVFRSIRSMVTAIAHIQKKFITLVWQVDNVLIEAGSLMQAGPSASRGLLLEVSRNTCTTTMCGCLAWPLLTTNLQPTSPLLA